MSRRMSCSLTVEAVRTRTKTVTRRHVDTWRNLKPGDRLTLIEKGMGLPKGAKQVVLAEVEVLDVRVEPIGCIDNYDLKAEGFPDMPATHFVVMWLDAHGYRDRHLDALTLCRRIEWRYIERESTTCTDGRDMVALANEPAVALRLSSGRSECRR